MAKAQQHDHIDQLLAQWGRQLPGIDVSPMAPVGRLHRLSQLVLQKVHNPVFDRHQISVQDFDVMAALFRSGPPYRQSPGELLAQTMVTSGTMTNRIDRLEESGFVAREADPNDRRGIQVVLTRKGKEALLRVLPEHIESERTLLSVLDAREQQQLSGLLSRLLAQFDG